MRRIELDATQWRTVGDFYDDLLRALGACVHHRRSPDALIESMIWGGGVDVEPPYVVSVTGLEAASAAVAAYVRDVAQVISDARSWRRDRTGIDIDVSVEVDGALRRLDRASGG
ncbi:MAG: hypothetical protein ACK4YQ_12315 [Phenylobacterium sp.]|uniref:barstar family protein n=1 Tax=Phenylobacterium sp. TaxID=1871053 RepID=UPI00391B8C92